uniref:CDK-activating kinase assembly factor MAT1 n=1 Tax=Gadus morhua TaxID=8049 RepID=A0A8C5AXC3_GADMO
MDDQGCPRCKTTKYRNPSLKLMVNVCGHTLCENCVDMLFVRGSGNCVQCDTPLRKSNFRVQLFEDPAVDKEVEIRKKLLKTCCSIIIVRNKEKRDNSETKSVEHQPNQIKRKQPLPEPRRHVHRTRDNGDYCIMLNFSLSLSLLLPLPLALPFPFPLQGQTVSLQPMAKIEEVLYRYQPLFIETYGPPVPELDHLGRLGYLKHVRAALPQDTAGGYSSGLACHRALQDAFSGLFPIQF